MIGAAATIFPAVESARGRLSAPGASCARTCRPAWSSPAFRRGSWDRRRTSSCHHGRLDQVYPWWSHFRRGYPGGRAASGGVAPVGDEQPGAEEAERRGDADRADHDDDARCIQPREQGDDAEPHEVDADVPGCESGPPRPRGLRAEHVPRRRQRDEHDPRRVDDRERDARRQHERQQIEGRRSDGGVDAAERPEAEQLAARRPPQPPPPPNRSCVIVTEPGRPLLFSYVRHTYEPTTPREMRISDVMKNTARMSGV